MDVPSSVSSIPQGEAHSTPDEIPAAHPFGWMRGIWTIAWGLGIGIVLSVAVVFLPYNRIVIFNQPQSPVLKVVSAHLRDGGFIVVYLRTEEGLLISGESSYFPPGYYRNIVVPLNFSHVYGELGREFIVRMYRDTGNTHFSSADDDPVKDVFGEIYQKRIWFRYPDGNWKQLWLVFWDHPVSFLLDVMIP